MADWTVIHADCLDAMRAMDEASVHAVVCDPPYLISFMGAEFDSQHRGFDAGSEGRAMQAWHEAWAREAFRVLKPGGFLLAFGGTRTAHRLACAIEDAGFEIRDRILTITGGGDAVEANPGPELAWVYGSGFP